MNQSGLTKSGEKGRREKRKTTAQLCGVGRGRPDKKQFARRNFQKWAKRRGVDRDYVGYKNEDPRIQES